MLGWAKASEIIFTGRTLSAADCLAEGLAKGDIGALPFTPETPEPVTRPRKQEHLIRHLMIPAARVAQKLGVF